MKIKEWICLGLAVLMLTGCVTRSTQYAQPVTFLDPEYVGGSQVTIILRDGSVVRTVHQETQPDGLLTTDGKYLYTDIDRYVWGGVVDQRSRAAPINPGVAITLRFINGESKRTVYRGATANSIKTDAGEFPVDQLQEVSWKKVNGEQLAASIVIPSVLLIGAAVWLLVRFMKGFGDAIEDSIEGSIEDSINPDDNNGDG